MDTDPLVPVLVPNVKALPRTRVRHPLAPRLAIARPLLRLPGSPTPRRCVIAPRAAPALRGVRVGARLRCAALSSWLGRLGLGVPPRTRLLDARPRLVLLLPAQEAETCAPAGANGLDDGCFGGVLRGHRRKARYRRGLRDGGGLPRACGGGRLPRWLGDCEEFYLRREGVFIALGQVSEL